MQSPGPDPLAPGTEGITVCHKDEPHDVYGGRASNRSILTADPGQSGWLGNPHKMTDDTRRERQRVIARFVPAFYGRLRSDPAFRQAVHDLAGQRVGGWCQHAAADGPRCHLEVLDAFLRGGRSAVREYCTSTLGAVPEGDGGVTVLDGAGPGRQGTLREVPADD
ncbi:MAG: DUF4326 domain-containing protein [Halobacteriales archaeon]